ncbi:ATP-dependent RNA helicase RhlB [Pseudomonas syringae pv. papulans]|nr:ATP-dependent RNA helicase RhlB [Pseudomonas syringae pv. papulans]
MFSEFALHERLLKAVAELKFVEPTPVQAAAIPLALQGRDLRVTAQTGSGKTAAFVLPILNRLIGPAKVRVDIRAVILLPTRELAQQTLKEVERFSQFTFVKAGLITGGEDFKVQAAMLRKVPDILIGTPGRLLEQLNAGNLDLKHVEVLVLDEADRMLDMGFIPQVRQIIRQTPHKGERQTLLFSATFTEDVMNLAKQWTTDPSVVEIESLNVASDNVEQHIYAVAGADKYKLLYNLVTDNGWERVMVFANRKDEVRRIEERLVRDGVNAAQLSGDVPQHKRIKTLEGFREGKIRVLVATDVAGRGIHIDGISHVINFTLPEVPDDYVHRIGRTGRAGADGVSISFAGEDDSYQLPAIEEKLGRKISCETPPTHLLRAVVRSNA